MFKSYFLEELLENSLIQETWKWLVDSPAKRPFLRVVQTVLAEDSNMEELTENVYEVIAALSIKTRELKLPTPPRWLREARENLHDTYTEGIRLASLAENAGVNPVYFARQFRRFFGCSVGRYIRQLQFQAATELLTQADINLAEVAYQIGFSDQSHLSRIFLNEFGITPGYFRKIIN